MPKNALLLVALLAINGGWASAYADELVRYQNQFSTVRIGPARLGDRTGLGVFFNGTQDLHFYARSETAPAPGLQLQIKASGPRLTFGAPVFPSWTSFKDPAQGKEVEVYVGDFQVFVPLTGTPASNGPVDVNVTISGLACTSQVCLAPFSKLLQTRLDPKTAHWAVLERPSQPAVSSGSGQARDTASDTLLHLLLAVLAGLSINIMPCVLPVIPLIILRLIGKAQAPASQRLRHGLGFCLGIILFFVTFAVIYSIVKMTTQQVTNPNDLYRSPHAVMGLFLFIVFFALVMLDIVPLTLPSSLSGHQSNSSILSGSIGMGLFAALLSIPCSGALLGSTWLWAYMQPLRIGNTAIVLMGVGMALPYAVLVLVPGLLSRVPRPGRWMEVFKKSCGFLLLLIAVKLTLAALPKERLIDLLVYGVIFSFCVWMWGQWVDAATPAPRKWAIRLGALAIAAGTGLWLLPVQASTGPRIAWQGYETQRVDQAKAKGQPVLLKFTADWCTNCKVVERRVYEDSQVVEMINRKGVLAIKADTTSFDSPATADFKQVYGEAGNVPVTILLMPGKPSVVLRGILDKSRLLDLLKDLPDEEKP